MPDPTLIAQSRSFYLTKEWKALRKRALAAYGGVCVACGATERLQVAHIKPRGQYPHLALDMDNVQELCVHCHSSKGTRTAPIRTNWLNPNFN